MKKQKKLMLVSGITGGLVYALLNAGFDYHDGQEFRLGKFLINLFFFGILMVLISWYNLNQQKKDR